MPYEVESPLASGLGFAASYLQGKQQRVKDQQQFEKDQADLALTQQSTAIAQQQANTAATTAGLANESTQQGITASAAATDAGKKMQAWFAAHPQPDINDSKKYGAWVGQAVSYAHAVGANDLADKIVSDYRAGQLGNYAAANATFTGGAKTAETNSVTRLNNAKTKFEQAHAVNEQSLFQHQLEIERQKGSTALQQAYVRANAMVQAQASRISAQLGIANMSNNTRIAIAQAAAMNMANGKGDAQAIALAMEDYRVKSAAYLKNSELNATGHPVAGFDPTAPAPTPQQSINMFMPSQMPAASSPISIVVQTPNGPVVTQQANAGTTNLRPATHIYLDAEVPTVMRLLSEGKHREEIVARYEAKNVSSQEANKVIAVAEARLRNQKRTPQPKPPPAAAPAPQQGGFLQNLSNGIHSLTGGF